MTPCSHKTIDDRILKLTAAVVSKIDIDRSLLPRLAQNLDRWSSPTLQAEWRVRLRAPWPDLRSQLLAVTEAGAVLRQNAPLGGILPDAERAAIMREFQLKVGQ